MRKAVGKKLHSQTGASLLIALLYLLAVMTAGAVVLTAAANAGRLARNRREQQDYLAVSSAALLVKEDFRGTAFTAGYQKTTVTSMDEEGNMRRDTHYGKTSSALSGESELLRDGPEHDLVQLYFSTVPAETGLQGAAPAMSYPLTFTAADLPEVSGAMTVDTSGGARYTIAVELYIEEDGTHTNATLLLFTPTVSSTQSTEREYGADTETIKTTFTTAVTWDTPVITKGAAA